MKNKLANSDHLVTIAAQSQPMHDYSHIDSFYPEMIDQSNSQNINE